MKQVVRTILLDGHGEHHGRVPGVVVERLADQVLGHHDPAVCGDLERGTSLAELGVVTGVAERGRGAGLRRAVRERRVRFRRHDAHHTHPGRVGGKRSRDHVVGAERLEGQHGFLEVIAGEDVVRDVSALVAADDLDRFVRLDARAGEVDGALLAAVTHARDLQHVAFIQRHGASAVGGDTGAGRDGAAGGRR